MGESTLAGVMEQIRQVKEDLSVVLQEYGVEPSLTFRDYPMSFRTLLTDLTERSGEESSLKAEIIRLTSAKSALEACLADANAELEGQRQSYGDLMQDINDLLAEFGKESVSSDGVVPALKELLGSQGTEVESLNNRIQQLNSDLSERELAVRSLTDNVSSLSALLDESSSVSENRLELLKTYFSWYVEALDCLVRVVASRNMVSSGKFTNAKGNGLLARILKDESGQYDGSIVHTDGIPIRLQALNDITNPELGTRKSQIDDVTYEFKMNGLVDDVYLSPLQRTFTYTGSVEEISKYAFRKTYVTELKLPLSYKSDVKKCAALPFGLQPSAKILCKDGVITPYGFDFSEGAEDDFTIDDDRTLTIPSGCERVKGMAMRNRYDVFSVKINSESLSQIGARAFEGCRLLESFVDNKPDGALFSVLDYAFKDCVILDNADISRAVSIGYHSFENVKSVNPDIANARNIADEAFVGCGITGSLKLPKCESLGNRSFAGCSGIKSINLPSVVTIGMESFSGCSSIEGNLLNIPEAESIAYRAFYGAQAMTSLNAPKLKHIYAEAFVGTSIPSADIFKGEEVVLHSSHNGIQYCHGTYSSVLNGGSLVITDASDAGSLTWHVAGTHYLDKYGYIDETTKLDCVKIKGEGLWSKQIGQTFSAGADGTGGKTGLGVCVDRCEVDSRITQLGYGTFCVFCKEFVAPSVDTLESCPFYAIPDGYYDTPGDGTAFPGFGPLPEPPFVYGTIGVFETRCLIKNFARGCLKGCLEYKNLLYKKSQIAQLPGYPWGVREVIHCKDGDIILTES